MTTISTKFFEIITGIGLGKKTSECLISKKTTQRMNVKPDIKGLYEQHRTAMLRLALRLLGDEEESRDVVSDVFAHLAEEQRAQSHAYLFTAVRNRCLNLLRHKRLSERVHRMLPIGEDVSEEPLTTEPKDEMEAMLQFIETELTPQTREVVRLRFREQKRYHEIAEQLGISEAAVYKHLAQGIRKLKARFNP